MGEPGVCPEFWVNGIERPTLGRDCLNLLVDCSLQRDQNGVEIRSDSANHFNEMTKLDKDGLIEIIAEHKRFAYHKPAGTILFDFIEKLPVCRFKFINEDGPRKVVFARKLPPDVVDADEDAEDVGIVVETIPSPAVFEVADGVAADTSINNVQVVSWIFSQQEIGDEMDVAEAEGFIALEVSVGVGNTVADEENFLAVLYVDFVLHVNPTLATEFLATEDTPLPTACRGREDTESF